MGFSPVHLGMLVKMWIRCYRLSLIFLLGLQWVVAASAAAELPSLFMSVNTAAFTQQGTTGEGAERLGALALHGKAFSEAISSSASVDFGLAPAGFFASSGTAWTDSAGEIDASLGRFRVASRSRANTVGQGESDVSLVLKDILETTAAGSVTFHFHSSVSLSATAPLAAGGFTYRFFASTTDFTMSVPDFSFATDTATNTGDRLIDDSFVIPNLAAGTKIFIVVEIIADSYCAIAEGSLGSCQNSVISDSTSYLGITGDVVSQGGYSYPGFSPTPTTTTPGGGGSTTTSTVVPTATEEPINGGHLALKASTKPAKRLLSMTSKDAHVALGAGNGSAADPRTAGAKLRVFSATGDAFDDVYDLPAAHWRLVGSAGHQSYRYAFKAGAPIKSAVVKPKLLRIRASGNALAHTLAANPDPVNVVLTMGGVRYCASFGGTVKFKAGKSYDAKAASAPPGCP